MRSSSPVIRGLRGVLGLMLTMGACASPAPERATVKAEGPADAAQRARAVGPPPPPSADTSPPEGVISLAGRPDFVDSLPVNLELDARDDVGVTQMCISERARCTDWRAYQPKLIWPMRRGAGARTLRAWFRDAAGNVSAPESVSFVVDMRAPTPTRLSATPILGGASLTWPDFIDAESGIDHYEVVWDVGGAAPLCDGGRAAPIIVTEPHAEINALRGVPTSFRVCGVDRAGNRSVGATATVTPRVEHDAPEVRTFKVNGGNRWTNDRTVHVDVNVTDASGVRRMCLTEDPAATATSCPAWRAFTPSFDWELSARDGTKTLRAFFRDPHNNITPTPGSATITFDWLRPDNGDILLTGGSGQVTVSWDGFTDSESGVESYILVMNEDERATIDRCSAYPEVWRGTDTSTVITGLDAGRFYSFRVCAVDRAGNISTGDNANITLPRTFDPPDVERFLIDGGAPTTTQRGVSLFIDPTDHSTITRMCLSDTPTCSAWQRWSPTLAYRLPEGLGEHRVYVWLRDENGLEMTSPASTSINVVTADTGCAYTEASFEGHDYLFCDEPTPWEDAEEACVGEGMRLVSINSWDEQDFIQRITNMPAKGSGIDWSPYFYWTGLNDRSREGSFVWNDGSDVTFSYWHWTAPDDAGGAEDCVYVGLDTDWDDTACASELGYICESGALTTLCEDNDWDGHGDPNLPISTTAASLDGYAAVCDDCNDADGSYARPPSGLCDGPDDPPTDDPPDPIPDPEDCAAGATVTVAGTVWTGSYTGARRTVVRASASGWYHLYDAYVAESGASQRNESGYLNITNPSNPSGKPAEGNCNGEYIVVDNDNSGAPPSQVFIGTFYLEAGDNTLTLKHYCPLQRAGQCGEFHNTSASGSTCGSGNVNSIHLDLRAFCAVNPNE